MIVCCAPKKYCLWSGWYLAHAAIFPQFCRMYTSILFSLGSKIDLLKLNNDCLWALWSWSLYLTVLWFVSGVWFQTDEAYEYSYEGTVDTQLLPDSLSSNQHAKLTLKCNVEILPLQGCDRLLKVRKRNFVSRFT